MSSLKKHIEEFEKNFDNSLDSGHQDNVDTFNSDGAFGLKDITEQHHDDLADKDRIIENLKQQLESNWMENKLALNTKKMYEAKIKKMNIVDSTKLIPTLIEVSREKQGTRQLDWNNWLNIPESSYLFQINESLARKVFQEANASIQRKKIRGTAPRLEQNYALTFTGPTNSDYVSTEFDPNELKLYNGFTLSFWVKPDGWGQKYALGLKHDSSPQYHFAFGIKNVTKGWVGVGGDVEAGWNHGMEAGNWYHYVVTYNGDDDLIEDGDGLGGNRDIKVYIDGVEKFDGNADWPVNKRTIGQEKVFIGARNNDGFGGGWNCSIDDVAIFDEVKDVSSLHDGSFNPIDQRNNSRLVGYWRFNEGSGTTVQDLSGNNNDGTLTTDGTELPTWTKIGSYE